MQKRLLEFNFAIILSWWQKQQLVRKTFQVPVFSSRAFDFTCSRRDNMFLKMLPQALILASLLLFSLPLSLSSPVEARSGPVCSSGIYRDLLFLSAYTPAQAYCSANYAQPVVTKRVNKRWGLEERGVTILPTTTTTTTTTTTSTTSTTTTTSTSSTTSSTTTQVPTTTPCPRTTTFTKPTPKPKCTGQCATWSSLEAIGGGILSTFCSCIETPKTVTIHTRGVSLPSGNLQDSRLT